MEKRETPKWLHVFVCVNDRHGERQSCADGGAEAIRGRLKAIAKERGWWNRSVRVSASGCLGLCQQGPNILVHPQGAHYSRVSVADLDRLVEEIEESLSAAPEDIPPQPSPTTSRSGEERPK
jgi:(2Fe-2S) ferredoxin